jgi:putative two-component system response regulator
MTSAAVRRLLIVEDEPSVMAAHARYVESLGYEVERAADGFEALSKLALGIDLVLLDISMPGMDGFEVATRIRALPEHAFTPIVMVTGLDRETWYPRALEVGANDVMSKPINAHELRLRTRWLLELKAARDELERRGQRLSEAVERKTSDLRAALEETSRAERRIYDAHLDTIRRLTVAAEYKDEHTAGHIARVGLSAAVLARAVGFPPGRVDMIRHAAQMHDVGKIGIPDEVLLKRGPLDDVERALMREHPRIGADLLAGSDSEVIQMGASIAFHHHERWDGRGYPRGVAGEEIPHEARICAVVDVFDAATMDRPYRRALKLQDAKELVLNGAGTQFEASLVEAFADCYPEIVGLRDEFPGEE